MPDCRGVRIPCRPGRGGRKNQAEVIMAALRATVSRASNGGREIRRYSWPMASARLVGSGTRWEPVVIVS